MGLIKKIFLFILFVFLVSSLLKNFFEYRKNIGFYEGYKKNLDLVFKKNLSLKTEKLQTTSMHEVEKTIRNKLGLLKPGEVAIIIPPPSPSPAPVISPPPPVYKQWWSVFFN